MTVSWAKPSATAALIKEFQKWQDSPDSSIKWAIANAMTVVADDSVFAEIVGLIQDPRSGNAREMLALSLGNMIDPRAEDLLIQLLDEDSIAGMAIEALGKLKSKKAVPAIERFISHPKTWIRNKAKTALAKIEKTKWSD